MVKAISEGDGLDFRALFVLKESMVFSVSFYRVGRCFFVFSIFLTFFV